MNEHMSVWEIFHRHVRGQDLLPGMTFQTTLLGSVAGLLPHPGADIVGIIPATINMVAKEHGFLIVAADYYSNTYTIRILESWGLATWSTSGV